MALARLWNAVFGSRTSATEAPSVAAPAKSLPSSIAPAASQPSGKAVAVSTKVVATKTVAPAQQSVVKLSRKQTKARQEKQTSADKPVVATEPAPVLRMFRRKNNAWTKLIGTRSVQSILDTNVGDGSRAAELLEGIVDSNSLAPKYIAIGMFELAGEKLTVRDFHKKIRSVGGQPVVIPMPLAEGLRRVSQTVGTVDLILLAGNDQPFTDPAIARLLQRITSGNTLILRCDAAGRWNAAGVSAKKAA